MNEDTAPSLTPAQRKALKAQAHHLKPVVMIGDAGLTDAVLAEADRALRIHELIKIRVLGDDRATRDSLMAQVCAGLDCAPVQSIGKLLVVYRPRADDEATNAPGAVKRKRRGPHRPKKVAGAKAEAKAEARGGAKTVARKVSRTGGARKSAASPGARSSTGRKSPAKSTARPGAGRKSAAGAGRAASSAAATRDIAPKRPSTRAPSPKGTGMRDSPPPAKRSLSAKTAGKRTDLASGSKRPARHGLPSKATQGPPRLQGKPGPRTAGRRNRAKGGGS